MQRREFIKYMGATGALVAGSNWIVERLWSMMQKGEISQRLAEPPGLEAWVPSICRLCPAGCGIKVRLIDGLPVKIEGNPVHPLNMGGVCAAGHAGLQTLYNPDRIRGPMRRTGPPGSNSWEPINWDEALALLAERLQQIRRAAHAQRVLFLDGGSRGLLSMIFSRFCTSYGTPNYIRTEDWDNRKLIYHFMQGYDDIPGFDLQNSRFVLSFGADLLAAESSPVWFARQLRAMRQSAGRPRGRLVQIEPRMSVTAAKADKWVPVNVGTEGALAMGIAYMMIQENMYDAAFVEEHTFGFENWVDEAGRKHIGFKTLVLTEYYPEAVSRITGVPIEDIVLLARKFAENQPGVAISGAGVARQSNGFYAQMAIHALNALAGNISKAGGVVQRKGLPMDNWRPPETDESARLSLAEKRVDHARSTAFPLARHVPANLATHLLNENPYPIELLLLYKSNPVFELADSEKMKQALAKIPLIVSFNSFLDESSEFAHLLLPDCMSMESWQEDFNAPYIDFDYFSLSPPLIKPIADTRPTADVVLTLAKTLGGSISKSLPFESYQALMKWAAGEIYNSGRGMVIESEFDQGWMQYLEERGWRYPRHQSFDQFWEHLLQQGGWLDPVKSYVFGTPKSLLKTPSKKFEFYSQTLQRELGKFTEQEAKITQASEDFLLGSMINNLKIAARGDAIFLPHHEEVRINGDPRDYPFILVPYDLDILGSGLAANSPMLLEMTGFRHYIRWDSWLELHPETANDLGLHEGEFAWLQSPEGSIKVRVHVFRGAQPDLAYVPIGLGHTAVGRYAKDVGANPTRILVPDSDLTSGIPIQAGTRVAIQKLPAA